MQKLFGVGELCMKYVTHSIILSDLDPEFKDSKLFSEVLLTELGCLLKHTTVPKFGVSKFFLKMF